MHEQDLITSSEPAQTLHLIGPGAVGRALLTRLADHDIRLVAITDRSGTLHDPEGLDPRGIARFKESGGRVIGLPGSARLPVDDAIRRAGSDILADTTSTSFGRPEWADILERDVLGRGAALALAAKDAVCRRADRWLDPEAGFRVGANAVLGGTGRRLVEELPVLRLECRAFALAGNASTTTIIRAIEAGGSFDDGLRAAGAAGLLETDPELDLKGADAAVKLAIVAGAVLGRAIDPTEIPCTHLREVSVETIRERVARNRTTRLIGRLREDGRLAIDYEEVPVDAALATRADRVAYLYQLADGTTRAHRGSGLGADGTAEALLADVLSFLPAPRVVVGDAR